MEKTTNCVMCGKELQKGFFTGDHYNLSAGSELLTVCKDCYHKYHAVEKVHKNFRYHQFDDILNEYLELKAEFEKQN